MTLGMAGTLFSLGVHQQQIVKRGGIIISGGIGASPNTVNGGDGGIVEIVGGEARGSHSSDFGVTSRLLVGRLTLDKVGECE